MCHINMSAYKSNRQTLKCLIFAVAHRYAMCHST